MQNKILKLTFYQWENLSAPNKIETSCGVDSATDKHFQELIDTNY
jgi:hypothetical protein